MMTVHVFPRLRAFAAIRAGLITAGFAVLLGATVPAWSQTAATDPVVATVNGTQIRESEILLADEIIGRNLVTQDKVERRETIIKMLVDQIALSKIAQERKIEDTADMQRRIAFARNQGLMTQLLAVVGSQAVTEDAIRLAYDSVVAKSAPESTELHLRHIFFLFKDAKDDAAVKEAEAKAQAALKRIKGGEDFAAVVADMSEDTNSRGRGGDYDWRIRAEMGKEYADVAFNLKKGEVSAPIRTPVGWHIIKLEDQRTRKPPELAKVRDRIAAMVAGNAQFELVDKARSSAKVVRFDQPAGEKPEAAAATKK